MKATRLRNQDGFTFVDVILLITLISIAMAMVIAYVGVTSTRTQMVSALNTRDRIWTGIQMMAAMPATLRNSARAALADGISPMNRELRNCTNGTQKNACVSGQESGFALYSPVVNLNGLGEPMGIQQVTAAVGSSSPILIDSFGYPCAMGNPNCIFTVFTSFVPHCAPAILPAVLPPNMFSPNLFAATTTCTVADYVEVKFSIEIIKDASGVSPELAVSLAGKTGSVFVSVKSVSGNDPQ